MLCNVTGVMTLPDGQDATGVLFTMIPSVGGVVSVGADTVAQVVTNFRVGQGGAVDFTAQSGEYVLRSACGRINDTVVYIPETADVDVNDVVPVSVPIWDYKTTVIQGDTLSLRLVYTNDYGVPQSFAGVTVSAEMTAPDGTVTPLTTSVEVPSEGVFILSAASTDALAAGKHIAKVSFDNSGVVSSVRFSVNVV